MCNQGFYELTEGKSSKFNIQKAKIMTSGPITSWHTEGEKVEAVTKFIFFLFFYFILLVGS